MRKMKEVVEDVFFYYSDIPRNGSTKKGRAMRNIIIVGHDVHNDMGHLSRIGVDVSAAGNFLKTVDTQDLHQHWSGASDARSLRFMLDDIGIQHKNLHNGGNDAAYTLQAMVAMCVNTMAQRKPLLTGKQKPKTEGKAKEKA